MKSALMAVFLIAQTFSMSTFAQGLEDGEILGKLANGENISIVIIPNPEKEDSFYIEVGETRRYRASRDERSADYLLYPLTTLKSGKIGVKSSIPSNRLVLGNGLKGAVLKKSTLFQVPGEEQDIHLSAN
jgi:hypothetical protein